MYDRIKTIQSKLVQSPDKENLLTIALDGENCWESYPDDGEILALVGGTNYNTSQCNRAISAKRQVGSTMKPFLYYSALESGFTSASSFISEKTTFSFANSKTYTPKNYNDKYNLRLRLSFAQYPLNNSHCSW